MLPLKTNRVWNKLEGQRTGLINLISDLEQVVLLHRISDKKWNILEILQHLVMSEKLSMIYLKKKWKYSKKLPSKTILTNLRSWTLQFLMWYPFPLRAPARVNVFDPDRTLQDIIQEWRHIRTEMYKFLGELDSPVFNYEFYKHPAVGKLTLDHMLRFFYAHGKRHEKQVRKILKRLNIAHLYRS